jgi:putative ABC transport system permease protein
VRQLEFFDRVLAGLHNLPSVRYAAVSSSPPMTTFNEIATGLRTEDGSESDETVSITSASAEYFQALGIPLVAGRFFDARDARDAAPTAVVNQSLAGLLFPGRDPLGRRILLDKNSFTVVGVVADMRHRALDDKIWPELFRPFEQSPSPWLTLLVRSGGDPSALANPVRGVVQSIDLGQPVFDMEPLEQRISKSLATRRERALVLGAFAALALAIAVVGIYGVLAYSVARRTHEIGLRMALGAGPGEVLRLVVGAGLRLAAAGMAVGLAGALALTRVLSTFLYGTQSTDAATFSLVCAILAAAVLCASYLPARRAAQVDPMTALRRE